MAIPLSLVRIPALRLVYPGSVKQEASVLTELKRRLRVPPFRGRFIMRAVFTAFYRKNMWFNAESRSGPGSTLEITQPIRTELPALVGQLGVRRLLDIPCGDFHWMKGLDLDIDSYIGADLVSDLVDANTRRHGNSVRRFLRLDVTCDALPKADLVLCRDCLVHLPERYVWRAIDGIRRSGATYLLTTTFPSHERNRDIAFPGQWRPLNLEADPYGFPAPLRLLDEGNTWKADRHPGKSLGLWRTRDLSALGSRTARGDR